MKASAARQRRLAAEQAGKPPTVRPDYQEARDQAAIRWLEHRGYSVLSQAHIRRLGAIVRKATAGSPNEKAGLPKREDPLEPDDPALLRAAFKWWMRQRGWSREQVELMTYLDRNPALQEIVMQSVWRDVQANCTPEERKDLNRETVEWLLKCAKSVEFGISEADRQRLKSLGSSYLKAADSAAFIKRTKGREALVFQRDLRAAKSKREKAAVLMHFSDGLSNDADFCSELPTAIRFLKNQPTAKAWLVEYTILQGSAGKYTRSEIRLILGITDRALRKICHELRKDHNVHVPFKEDRKGRPNSIDASENTGT